MKEEDIINDNELQQEVQEQDVQNIAADNQEENLETATSDTDDATADAALQLAELQEQCANLQDKNLRMMAEFDNFRRRTAKEKLDLQKTAGENIFRDMLPLIDDFERALTAIDQTEDIVAVRDGVQLIYQKFMSFLEKHDVKVIETHDVDFNTEYHEAITLFPASSEDQKGKVVDCVQNGYTLGDKVIRYAKVVVAQ